MSEKFKDKCGVFGVYGHPDAVALTLSGLAALQHRGQESAGIAYCAGGKVDSIKMMGRVAVLARQVARAQSAAGARAAIGHVRYGTSGSSSIEAAQPFVALGRGGRIALCHNGHIVDIDGLRRRVKGAGQPGHASDTELLTLSVATHFDEDIADAIKAGFRDVTPSYSVAVLTSNSLCAVRDPLGMRPLSLGRKGSAVVVSSETCAFDAIGATHLRDVTPGEIVVAQGNDLHCHTCATPRTKAAHCIFELIYFARPDSVMFGHRVADFRMQLGRHLAAEAPAAADIVVPVPQSAVYGAHGYAQASGIELALALFRNELAGRTFIEPTPAARTAAIRAKFKANSRRLDGLRVVLIDDSIVRGNTCLYLVRMLREAGAREVHVRITSPPTIASCHFGVDTPDDRELFAAGRGVSEMTRAIGADSLEFLSLEGLMATAAPMTGFCAGCFSAVYPMEVPRALQAARCSVPA